MKALILDHPGCLVLKNVAKPEVGTGDLVIQVKAATTCGTDLKAFVRGHPQIPMPGPLGHEYSGVVVEAGSGAKFAVGDAVMGVHSAPCQECRWCLLGQENLCETIMATKVLGSYAEFLLIPERVASRNVFRKPAHLSFEEAALLEPVACVAQGVLELERRAALPAASALVIGPGAIGLMFVQALRASGVSRVVLAGRNPARLAVGSQVGAETRSWPDVEEKEFDIVVECTGQVEVWERSVEFSRRGGTVVLFGGCATGTRVSFDTRRLHYDQISLLSPFHFGTQAVKRAHRLLADGMVDGKPMISGTRGLEEAEEVFGDLIGGCGIKYAFVP